MNGLTHTHNYLHTRWWPCSSCWGPSSGSPLRPIWRCFHHWCHSGPPKEERYGKRVSYKINKTKFVSSKKQKKYSNIPAQAQCSLAFLRALPEPLTGVELTWLLNIKTKYFRLCLYDMPLQLVFQTKKNVQLNFSTFSDSKVAKY